jgi:hypothetical protein
MVLVFFNSTKVELVIILKEVIMAPFGPITTTMEMLTYSSRNAAEVLQLPKSTNYTATMATERLQMFR